MIRRVDLLMGGKLIDLNLKERKVFRTLKYLWELSDYLVGQYTIPR